MKKIFLLPLLAICALVVSCRQGTNTEEEVRNYGKYFVEKLSANEIDSLTESYPDITAFDTYATIESDTIMVQPAEESGKYVVTLADGISLLVSREDGGKIVVHESHGIFSFPEDKVDLAMKTGMWDDEISDAEMAERMNDEGFFSYIDDIVKEKTSNILSVQGSLNMDTQYQYIVNNTDEFISGSDYTVTKEECMFMSFMGEREGGCSKYTVKGKDIKPHGKVAYEAWASASGNSDAIVGVKLKLSKEELREKFVHFAGDEYQDYLASKGED